MATVTVTKHEIEQRLTLGFLEPAGAFDTIEIRDIGQFVIRGIEFDWRGYNSGTARHVRLSPSNLGLSGFNGYLRIFRDADDNYRITYTNIVEDSPLDDVVTVYEAADVPAYIDYPSSLTEGPQTITDVHDSTNRVPPPPTYAQKQQAAIRGINEWYAQKRTWMAQAAERADLHVDVIEKCGDLLRAATAALKSEFQDSTVDRYVVQKLAQEAVKGSLDITTVDAFIQSVHYGITPVTPVLWVTKGDGSGVDAVARVNAADVVRYDAALLPAGFDSLDRTWLTENQAGKVVINNFLPVVGDVLTATISDLDGGVTAETYQWQNKGDGADDVWEDITDATTSSYTTVAADEDKAIRVLVTYTDNYGPNQTATAAATQTVLP